MKQDVDCIHLVDSALSGGRITTEIIDNIDSFNADSLKVSGLRQDTFEYLVAQYGNRFRSIFFWKCPGVEDLTPLEDLSQIESIRFFWNTKAIRFWDMHKTPKLKSLEFSDFTRLRDLGDLSSAQGLEHLSFGNSPSGKTSIVSLIPIASLQSLVNLSLNPTKIDDGQVSPISLLPNLKFLNFSSRLFRFEQIAWLAARLPRQVECDYLRPFVSLRAGTLNDADVMILGKGKPFLNSSRDAQRIKRYVDEFERLVDLFRKNPAEPEPLK